MFKHNGESLLEELFIEYRISRFILYLCFLFVYISGVW